MNIVLRTREDWEAKSAEYARTHKDEWQDQYFYFHLQVIDQINRLMEAKNISRADLARLCGVSRAWISRILNEKGNFQAETLAKIAAALDVDIGFRLIEKDEWLTVSKRSNTKSCPISTNGKTDFTVSVSEDTPPYRAKRNSPTKRKTAKRS